MLSWSPHESPSETEPLGESPVRTADDVHDHLALFAQQAAAALAEIWAYVAADNGGKRLLCWRSDILAILERHLSDQAVD